MVLNKTPFDWQVPVAQINSLLVKPTFEPGNILTDTFFTRRMVKTETTLHYLDRPKKFLQSNDNCDWRPKGKMTLSARKLAVKRIKIQMEHCNAEFFDTCLENLLGAGHDIFGMFDSPATADKALKLLQEQMVVQTQLGIVSDLNLLAWLGNASSGDEFFGLLDGILRLLEIASANNEVTQLNLGSGAALPPNGAVEIFKEMHAKAPLQLRQMPKNLKRFTVTEDIFTNYSEYLQALGTEQANQYIINGTPEGLLWNGIKIIPKAEIDEELNTAETFERRAIYSAEGNLWTGTDITSDEVSIRIYQDIHMLKWYIAGYLKFGAQYAHKELIIHGK